MLGLLALIGIEEPPALVGFEEPENGVHPRRIQLIAELLKTRKFLGQTQHILTTHSPILPDMLQTTAFMWCAARIVELTLNPLPLIGGHWGAAVISIVHYSWFNDEQEDLPMSVRILRGDFDS